MRLSFQTAGDWRTSDLARFLDAVESIYNVFLAALHAQRALGKEMDNLLREWGAPPVQEYRDAEDVDEEEVSGIIPPWVVDRRSSDLATYLEFIHQHVRNVAPEDVLRISSVRMSSPGNISFEGLGEPIREVRELIRDLTYRISDDKKLSRLEVAEKYIEFAVRWGVVGPSQVPELVQAVLDGADVLEELRAAGNLPQLPPSIEPSGPTADPDEDVA